METARVFFGLAAPLAVSWEREWFSNRPRLALVFSLAYGACAIAPYRDDAKALGALGVSVLMALGLSLVYGSHHALFASVSIFTPVTSGRATINKKLGVILLAIAAVTAVWVAGATIVTLVAQLLLSDKAIVMTSALLLAVFGGGSVVKAATDPVKEEVRQLQPGPAKTAAEALVASGGRSIGLFERGVLFVFLAAGQPEAAALVLAAKALARAPVDHVNHASKYFLVGTLGSVIASAAMSMAARSAIGLPIL
ncbi:hypothetical protein AB0G60_06725 [Streptomyces angustmyceticus]|uniref:Uncharacterized protein n=1 Tax=Streptomyces angustmyceticus TaxID=285578 RepID=A0A5J4LCI3_9ACTN|nr:hypothetical protein [Streptomyces angustmyceticus]UAL69157.1 hypothetical protein K7396_23655 [Streptomyces angustmyceticus]GES29581.1 hypothetical protein San01_20680 [Streptomyces angustmyceticus]